MTIEFINGFNDAIKGIYNNPYSELTKDGTDKYYGLFMHYHNGHNTGSDQKRQGEKIPHKIYCVDLSEVKLRYPAAEVKEVTGNFNMLMLKDNQFTATCNDGKYYLLTV